MKKSHSFRSLLYTFVVYACSLYLISIAGCAKLHAQNIPVYKEASGSSVTDSASILVYIQGSTLYGRLTYANPVYIRVKNLRNSLHVDTTAYFRTNGNSGFNVSNYLGTNDATALKVRTNNVERMRIDASGNIMFGATSPYANRLFFVNGKTCFADTFQLRSSGYAAGKCLQSDVNGNASWQTPVAMWVSLPDTFLWSQFIASTDTTRVLGTNYAYFIKKDSLPAFTFIDEMAVEMIDSCNAAFQVSMGLRNSSGVITLFGAAAGKFAGASWQTNPCFKLVPLTLTVQGAGKYYSYKNKSVILIVAASTSVLANTMTRGKFKIWYRKTTFQ